MSRFFLFSALVLSSAMMVPVSAKADDRDHHERRYYDRRGHDYHTWNGNEDRAYRAYLDEHHRPYRDFGRVGRGERDNYWGWRHQHPDSALFKVEIR
jgi:hypothetical protein